MYTNEQRRTIARIRRAGYQIVSSTRLSTSPYRLVLHDNTTGKLRTIVLNTSGSYHDQDPTAKRAI